MIKVELVRVLVTAERLAQVGRDAGRSPGGAPRQGRAYLGVDEYRDLSAVEALFASLDTQDADLIVAGAFGHSRLYEGLFGGGPSTSSPAVLLVLMSH